MQASTASTLTKIVCFALSIALVAPTVMAAAQPNEHVARFALSSAFQPAERNQATGLYVLGTTSIRTWTATHYVLLRNGRSLQIHTKANGAWLSKLPTSSGGLTIGAARFDELLAIAGGVNRNTKDLPQALRERFHCRAGFGSCGAADSSKSSEHAMRRVLGVILNDAHAAEGVCPQCQQYFVGPGGAQTFRFEFDATSRRIIFDGWDIRAVWPTPPLDEI